MFASDGMTLNMTKEKCMYLENMEEYRTNVGNYTISAKLSVLVVLSKSIKKCCHKLTFCESHKNNGIYKRTVSVLSFVSG